MGTILLNRDVIFGAAPSNILLTNLLSYYNFDEVSGNLLDIHGSEDASQVGTPVLGATGLINDAWNLGGDPNEGAKTLNTSPWDIATVDHSISLWYNLNTSYTSNQTLLDYRTASVTGLRLRYVNGIVNVDHNSVTEPANAETTIGLWQHILISADRDGTSTIYSNGVDGGTYNSSGSLTISGFAKFGIRSFSTPATYLRGKLDEVGIWNRALTSDEVALLYNSGAGLSYTNFG